MKFRFTLFLIAALACSFQSLWSQTSAPVEPPYSPSNRPRMAAEWEPAVGVLIAWPLSLPKELVVALSRDSKIYVMVDEKQDKQEVVKWLSKWGVTPDQARLVTAPQGIDAEWTRDWGPHAVFTEDGTMKLADAKYLYATPVSGIACDDSLTFLYHDDNNKILLTKIDDKAPEFIASTMDEDMVQLPFVFTGGNVITDGQRSGFSTCVLTRENRYTGVSDETFFRDVNQYLGMDQYHIISNYLDKGIQHIDCFMKMIDEERIFVLEPPKDHPAYQIYQGIVDQELSKLKNAYGRPYQILRIKTDHYEKGNTELAAYTNALILNQNVYVPLYGIYEDSVALKQYRDAMPGYTVKGFYFKLDPLKKQPYYRPYMYAHNDSIGWSGEDALHCRTRALWDPNMLYMSVDRIPATALKAKSYPVNVILKDYSKGSLVPDGLILHWRTKGDPAWKDVRLTPTQFKDQYSAEIPGNMADVTIEYYVEAKSNWGTRSVMPRVAPRGFYSFSVN